MIFYWKDVFMDLIIGLAAVFIILPLLGWLLPILYSFWLKFPKIFRYILFLPLSGILATVASFGITIVFFRDVFGTVGTDNPHWMVHFIPFFNYCAFVFVWSLAMVFLLPNHEKRILRAVLSIYIAFLIVIWGINFWMHVNTPSFDIIWPDFLGSIVSGVAASIVFWKAQFLHDIKKSTIEAF